MTGAEKVALLVGNDVFAFPHEDPDVAIDYCGCSGTHNLSQYIDIVNNTTISLYFKVDAVVISGDEAKWTDLTETIGLVGASGKAIYEWTPNRGVPTSKITETLRVWLKAYTDVGYTNLYGEDYTDFNYHFFSHADGTIQSFSDFETGFDEWSQTVNHGMRKTEYPYTGAYSLLLFNDSTDGSNDTVDSTGQTIPLTSQYISKSIDLSSYSTAYLVLHVTRWRKSGTPTKEWPFGVLWINTPTKDWLIRVPLAQNTIGVYRIAVSLPTVSATIKIAGLYSRAGAPTYIGLHIDSIIVIGFS